jgi:RES domain-containing protein
MRPPFGGPVVVWRLDKATHAGGWDSGEGAFRCGGRWNGRGVRAVYCALDPATAILEVAVHTGFKTLDTVRHVLTAAAIADPADIFVVNATDLPNPNWLVPGHPSARQMAFGADLLRRHKFLAIPSVVSRHSWNLIFERLGAADRYRLEFQEPFGLDGRLHPPPSKQS